MGDFDQNGEQTIAQNLADVRAAILAARERGRHAAASVRLLAVSKTVDAGRAALCWQAGVDGLAENKVQELLEKQRELPPDVRWHFIGHLQTNKAKSIIGRVALLHSLDSWRLAEELEKRAAAAGETLPCLVEVNVAAEESKFGILPGELADFLAELAGLPHLHIHGLMTVAPDAPAAEVRPVFARLRGLRDEARARAEKFALANQPMQELSMGMSNDYETAVEEGATIVRVGSRIFGGRIYR